MKKKEHSLNYKISPSEKERLIKEAIERSRKDSEEGRTTSHEVVMKRAREKIENWAKQEKGE